MARPAKWEDPEAFEKAVDEYFSMEIRHTWTGLAIHLGFESRQSLEDYKKKDGFSYPIKKDLVFTLPSANGANKTVKAWVRRAKIEKQITWHNARHSFGTNLIFNEVDVLTTSKLLGHTSMKHTQRYVDASNEMKENATKAINIDL